MATVDDLRRRIEELHQLVTDAGRDPASIAVQCDGGADVASALARPDEHAQLCDDLGAVGVTHVMLRAWHADPHEAADAIEAYGEAFIPPDVASAPATGSDAPVASG
jgi:hypothetical protein